MKTLPKDPEVKREVGYILLKFVHIAFLAVAFAIIGLFIFEKNVQGFEDYLEVPIVIPIKQEFEDNEQIKTILFAKTEHELDVEVTHQLRCDFGDGDGYGTVSHDNDVIRFGPTNDDFYPVLALATNADEVLSTSQIAEQLRALQRSANLGEIVVYSGDIPTKTAQCFFDVTLELKTKFFDVSKRHELISYPFEYVWYFTREQANEEDELD